MWILEFISIVHEKIVDVLFVFDCESWMEMSLRWMRLILLRCQRGNSSLFKIKNNIRLFIFLSFVRSAETMIQNINMINAEVHAIQTNRICKIHQKPSFQSLYSRKSMIDIDERFKMKFFFGNLVSHLLICWHVTIGFDSSCSCCSTIPGYPRCSEKENISIFLFFLFPTRSVEILK